MQHRLPASRFGMNHMAAPQLDIPRFFELAATLGIEKVEIRNDLSGNAILDGTPPTRVADAARQAGLGIASINALQRFNDWTRERENEAAALADYAAACGAEALVLVPVNDGSGRGEAERQSNLRRALEGLAPVLSERGILGLIEPLGFASSSLRSKREAVEAIDATGHAERFRLVHDTFHHRLAGEPELFPERTGLVHISGVADASVPVTEMRDPHRGLVDAADRLANFSQIELLLAGGYGGLFSFEPFAPEVHALSDPGSAIRRSMDFLNSQLAPSAA